MMRVLKTIWKEIRSGQYPETYLTILLGIIISILGVTSAVQLEVIIAATTALLALLAWGNLESKRTVEKLATSINNIENVSYSRVIATDFQANLEIKDLISRASEEIWILTRLGMTLQEQRVVIEQAVERGCKIKAIVCSDDEQTVEFLAKRGYSLTDPNELKLQIQIAQRTILSMMQRINLDEENFQFFELSYVPPHSIYISDPDTGNSVAFVQLGTFRTPTYRSISLKINRVRQPELFDFFRDQFRNYLNASTSIKNQEPYHS